MTAPAPQHILVARTDKIGDLLLTLPLFQTLRQAFPQARITALVSAYAKEIVEGHPAIDRVEAYDPQMGLSNLTRRFKELAPDVFIAVYPRAQQVLAAWRAGIPTRIGTAYRWYGYFLNQRVKVHRHLCEKHEVEYNLDLVKPLGVTRFADKIQFPINDADRAAARDMLSRKGIAPGTAYVAVHPGHKGSALNWSPQRYAELIGHLSRKGIKVVITGGADEKNLLAQVTNLLFELVQDQKPVTLVGECGLRQLAAVYEGASCFLSGSTGTMHLAAAMGTPTVALFCPIPATTPVRWGPWGNESTVLMPKGLKCGDCMAGYCKKHDPMDAISVGEVFNAVEKYHSKRQE